MTEFVIIDIVLLGLLILLVIRGFVRGFVKEFFSLGAVALGIFGAFLFYKNGGEFLRTRYFPNVKIIPEILAFIALFLIVFLVCKIIQKIINDVVSGMNLTTLDKVLGAVFGLLEGLLAVCLVLFVISVQPLFAPSAVLEGSIFGNIFLPLIAETSRGMAGASAVLVPPAGSITGTGRV